MVNGATRDNVAYGSNPPSESVRTSWTPAWQEFDTTSLMPALEASRTADRTQAVPQGNVLEVRYDDPNMDRYLSSGRYDTLKIDGLPQGVKISSWLDNQGFFFWYKNGDDNRVHHHLPANLRTIQVNGYSQSVDEMRLQASQAYMAEQSQGRANFYSLRSGTDPMQFAGAMSAMSGQSLQLEQNLLSQAANSSPNNPYFRIYLADTMIAQAMQPIIQQVGPNTHNVNLNNPYTISMLQAALSQVQQAQHISEQYGDQRYPNLQMMPGLYPYGLNPYNYNPDMYWGGALYQSWQREVILKMMLGLAPAVGNLELP